MNSIATGQRTHYDVLEVSQAASPEVLRAAYKSLIQRYHPDRNPDDARAAERSTLIVKAYQVLSDPVARTAYDLELRRQSVALQSLNIRRRDPPRSASPRSGPKEYRWIFLAPIFLLAVFLWFFWTTLIRTPPATLEPQTIASPREKPQPQLQLQPKDSNESPIQAARTVPDFIENLSVTLAPPSIPGDEGQGDATHVLSIKTIVLVVGAFDSARYIEFLKSNQEYISWKLSEKLANADYERLISKDGDRYLKQLILDSISEITNTKREPNTPADATSAAPYGAVEVVLPDAFSIESRQGSQVTIQRRNAQP